jgi:hypothetical protein
MWYKEAKQKVNTFGLPISGKSKFKLFADEDTTIENDVPQEENIPEEDTPEEQVDENGIVIPPIDPKPEEEVTIDDPTNDGEFSPEDLQTNIKAMEEDPTIGIKLPKSESGEGEDLHPNCHCRIITLPILSKIGVNEGRRVWKHSENCCEKCRLTAQQFNQAEIQRLLNKGIDVNGISR